MLKGNRLFFNTMMIFIMALCFQVFIGIATVMSCKGSIPVFLGVTHQLGAICIISALLYMNFRFVRN